MFYELKLDLAFDELIGKNEDEHLKYFNNILNKYFKNPKILKLIMNNNNWPTLNFSFEANDLNDAKMALLKFRINDDDFIIEKNKIDELFDEYMINDEF